MLLPLPSRLTFERLPAAAWLNRVTLVVTLLALLASGWAVQRLHESERLHQGDLAVRSAQSTAREVATLLTEMQHALAVFAQEKALLLAQLHANPEHSRAQQALADALRLAFPDHIAHTLLHADGTPLLDDMGESIGEKCQQDIAQHVAGRPPGVVVHPGPDVYHFDLMVPWQTPSANGKLFLRFRFERLAQLLQAAQLPHHRLLLVNARQPGLIEVSAQGSRDVLKGEHMLALAELKTIERLGASAPVPGTQWQAVSLPSATLWADLVRQRNRQAALAMAGVLLTMGLAWWVAHSALQRQARLAAQQRLTAVVFNSAQEGIAITDLQGRYLAVNDAFVSITEYPRAEVLGKTPQLLASGRHPAAFYQTMWETLRATGQWQGEIWNRRKGGEVYQEWLSISTVRNPQGEPENYVAVYTDISRIRHAQTELEHLAHHDALTDLPNRALLYSRLSHALERARRQGTQLAVLYLDLDGFKAVNDQLGHQVGDAVLQQVAQLLTTRLRGADTVARLGGDEFVLLLEGLPGEGGGEHALVVAHTVARLLSQPLDVGCSQPVVVGASIGIALYPQHGNDADSLLALADGAMYRAKQAHTGIELAANAQSAA